MARQLSIAVTMFFALLAVAAGLMMLYLVTYATLGSRSFNSGMYFQVYAHEWQEHLFRPAAQLESLIRQRPVDTAHITD